MPGETGLTYLVIIADIICRCDFLFGNRLHLMKENTAIKSQHQMPEC